MAKSESNYQKLITLSFYLSCMLILATIGVLAEEENANKLTSLGKCVWYHVVYQVEMFGKNEVSSQQRSTKRCASNLLVQFHSNETTYFHCHAKNYSLLP